MRLKELQWIKAKDIHNFVADTFAAGESEWPVPRSVLNGLRLKQVVDAIKIHTAQVYLHCLEGNQPFNNYQTLKEMWPSLLVTLPAAFTRVEEWESRQDMPPLDRHFALIGAASYWITLPSEMNFEERELYNEPENFESFLGYLEKVAKIAEHPFDHVLGHLSHGVIYVDDLIPILPRTEVT